jgi:uncharacterized delta-60 repeat protein
MSTFNENFDNVISPTLPAGWSSTAPPNSGAYLNTPWTTSSINPFSFPNDAFVPELPEIGTSSLDTPSISVVSEGGILEFKNLFNLQSISSVLAIVKQSDGKILVGGTFVGVTQNEVVYPQSYIARFFSDGTIDTSFDALNTNNTVFDILVRDDGKIYVAGAFNTIGGLSGVLAKPFLALLEPNGSADPMFDPNPSASVNVIKIQDNQLIAGGLFTTIGGIPRQRLARIDLNFGTGDILFDAGLINSNVLEIVTLPNSQLYVGGAFQTIGGLVRPRIARLGPNGSADSTFNAGNIVGNIRTIVPRTLDNKILVGGSISSIAAIPRNNIALIDNTGSLDMSFNPNADNTVVDIVVQPDDKILVGGVFTNIAGLVPDRGRIARLNSDGTGDTTFTSPFNPLLSPTEFVFKMVLDSGNILVGGSFQTVDMQSRTAITQITSNGSLVSAFNAGINELLGDGLVLNISINGDPFTDIIDAGGVFISGGYRGRIESPSNPLFEQRAWGGLSGGSSTNPQYITTRIVLPPAANGQSIKLRWTIGTDNGAIAPVNPGVRIDNVVILSRPIPCLHPSTLVLTNDKKLKPISSLKSGDYVTDHRGKLVPILYNMRFQQTKEFLKIPKDTLGPNLPSNDLYIRKDHPILYRGKRIKADRLRLKYPNVKRVTIDSPVNVWSLCTKKKTHIMMEGIPVETWMETEILEHPEFSFTKC